jgi:flagellar motor switch/type III secretory pathway protein FliN
MTELLERPLTPAVAFARGGVHARLSAFSRHDVQARKGAAAFAARLRLPKNARVRAIFTADAPLAGSWLTFTTPKGSIGLLPERIEGEMAVWPAMSQSPLLPDAIAAMDRLEPLIAAMETVHGYAWEVTTLGPAAEFRFGLEIVDSGGKLISLVWLTCSRAAAATLAGHWSAPAVGALLAAIRVEAALEVMGFAPPARELSRLGEGDVVLLPARPEGLAARLHLKGAGRFAAGLFKPTSRVFEVHSWEIELMSKMRPMAGADSDILVAGEATVSAADLPVQLTVSLSRVTMTVGEVGELAPGVILDLDLRGDDPQVELLAGDRRLALGRLVAVGEGYGVLIDRVMEP